ncbi:hypothetical protein DPX16_16462 [Anabarilius grahami]|uniref:Uncharacterized protein n=1 Tax=Anabarilius grahami TaxID=495550 RepID=A0A3N0XZH9_ANAGA|nr:hypothetical protein DPX16_16462 [Anabarilius grahami]
MTNNRELVTNNRDSDQEQTRQPRTDSKQRSDNEMRMSAAVLCPRGEAVLPRSCVNERGCQCCYLDYLQGAVSALNSTGPDTVSAAPSAATRLIQSVFGESALARCFSLLHTHKRTYFHSLLSESPQGAPQPYS